ncbi:MAG TPA: dynamin family protein, partial [Massilibacterium sp.]|nr:dynamin family protein [Massilibacterium sp.]
MEQLDFTRWYAQQKPNPKLLENRLTYLIKECSEDSLRVEKLKILQKKLNNFEWCLAFCGHFSAGKSTLINTILEQPLLPNSPIPTSANIVTIQKGKDIVEVLHESGEIFSFHQLDDVSVYAKDNEVKQIHLFLEQFPLPESFVLMDTPGLDSTIESHQSKTLEHLF